MLLKEVGQDHSTLLTSEPLNYTCFFAYEHVLKIFRYILKQLSS